MTAYNYIFVLNLLSTLAPRGHVASVWLNVSEFTWLYGWIVLGVYLPAWAYYGRKKYGYSLEAGVWVGIGFVVILLIGAVARPMFPHMGWTWAERLGTSLDYNPELGIVVGWAVVALALVSICCNCESRDRLLGRGKGLALLALTVLCIILALSLLTAWKPLAGNAACGVRDAKCRPSRVALSPKVRLSLQVSRCELSAALYERSNGQVLLHHRSPFEFRS